MLCVISYSGFQVSDETSEELTRMCSCCHPINSVERRVAVACRDFEGPRPWKRVVMRLKLPRGCMCRPCAPDVPVEPVEPVEVESKRAALNHMFLNSYF